MTPKKKAEQLVSNFYAINSKLITVKNGYDMGDRYNLVMPIAKNCALIAVDEIIKETKLHDKTIYQHGRTFYWQEVKQKIDQL